MEWASVELMLGGTRLGAQVRDARTVLRWMASRADTDASRVALWGDSPAGVNPADFRFDQSAGQFPGPFPQQQAEPAGPLVALMTALYEDRVRAVAAHRGLVSFLSVLENRFCHVPQDAIVPGILEAGDVPDIVTAIGPQKVVVSEPVDGRNRVAGPQADLAGELIRVLTGPDQQRAASRNTQHPRPRTRSSIAAARPPG
jgi:hypothetical protein